MPNTGKWLAGGVVLFLVAAGGIVVHSNAIQRPAPAGFAALEPAERNFAVFDAACRAIESNYFDQDFLKSRVWQDYKTAWREQAGKVASPLLYANVLANFAREFPDSHLTFEMPAVPVVQPVERRAAKSSPGLDLDKVMELLNSGPGYDTATIRRGGISQQTVSEVRKGSPAERVGIAPGWMVVGTGLNVDQAGAHFSATLLPLDEGGVRAVDNSALPPGAGSLTQREAYIGAHAAKFDFDLEKLPSRPDFEVRRFGDITYLRFDGFDAGGPAGKAMDVIENAGPAGLIIDLRRNHGGRGLELLRVLGRLLGNQTVIGYTRSLSAGRVPMKAFKLGGHYQGPVVMLIGPATSSAAEIAAAAIQDLKRGKLIGRRTSGSVVSASMFKLPDGGKVLVPVSDFVRIDERRIEGVGVEPDLWMPQTLDDVREDRDPALNSALAELRR